MTQKPRDVVTETYGLFTAPDPPGSKPTISTVVCRSNGLASPSLRTVTV